MQSLKKQKKDEEAESIAVSMELGIKSMKRPFEEYKRLFDTVLNAKKEEENRQQSRPAPMVYASTTSSLRAPPPPPAGKMAKM